MAIFKRKSRPPGIVVITSAPAGTNLHGTATSYTELYASSFAVRATVDFLARHFARYEVVSFMGEQPLKNDTVHELFRAPASGVSRFSFMEHLAVQLLVSGACYAPMLIDSEQRVRGLSPTAATVSLERPTGGPPIAYKLSTVGGIVDVPASDMFVVSLPNPRDPWTGVSPLDSLRALLAEEQAASLNRQGFWANSARKEGVITQSADAPPMSDAAVESFLVDVEDALTGDKKTARPLLLQPGQSWVEAAWSPRESEYVSARAQVLQLVAGCYGVPAQLVNTTTENLPGASRMIEEILAPHVERFESAINSQLVERVYGEQAVNGRIQVRLVQPPAITDKDIGATIDAHVGAGVLTVPDARRILGLPGAAP